MENFENKKDRLFINMEGYSKDYNWASDMENIIDTMVFILRENDVDKFESKIIELEYMIKSFDNIEAKDYKDIKFRLEKLKEIKNLSDLTAQDILHFLLSPEIIKYYRQDLELAPFKTPINKFTREKLGDDPRLLRFYESRPFGLPRETVRPWVQREFGVPVMTVLKYKAYSKRAMLKMLKNRLEKLKENQTYNFGYRMKTKNSIIIPDNKGGFVYKNPDSSDLELMITTDSLWYYPEISKLKYVWSLINELFAEIMVLKKSEKNEQNLNKIMCYVAQIHWLFSQGKLYRRGNASMADIFTKFIFDYMDIETSNWRSCKKGYEPMKRSLTDLIEIDDFINRYGVAPDLEAFVTELPEYIENYSKFMDKQPHWKSNHDIKQEPYLLKI
jgi:hypothetical protein